jgi:hypothetical protein
VRSARFRRGDSCRDPADVREQQVTHGMLDRIDWLSSMILAFLTPAAQQ